MGAGLDIPAIGAGARQVPLDEPHAFQRHAVRQRMKSGRAEGLEAMHEGIHAGGGRHVRGSPTVSSGSEMTMRGIICGWKMIFF